jgi:hypothetical protein
MDKEQQRIKIAEACGVTPTLVDWWAHKPDDTGGSIIMSAPTKEKVEDWISKNQDWAKGYSPKPFYRYPDYLNSLDAMHEAERWMESQETYECHRYVEFLRKVIYPANPATVGSFRLINATAAQRAEAFLKTLSLWTA